MSTIESANEPELKRLLDSVTVYTTAQIIVNTLNGIR